MLCDKSHFVLEESIHGRTVLITGRFRLADRRRLFGWVKGTTPNSYEQWNWARDFSNFSMLLAIHSTRELLFGCDLEDSMGVRTWDFLYKGRDMFYRLDAVLAFRHINDPWANLEDRSLDVFKCKTESEHIKTLLNRICIYLEACTTCALNQCRWLSYVLTGIIFRPDH